MKPKLSKLPMIEWAYRWIDVFTYFDYPEDVRKDAYVFLTAHMRKMKNVEHPSTLATAALYLSCEKNDIKFNFDRLNSIMRLYFSHRKQKWGMRSGNNNREKLMERVKKWKLSLK